jgi:hypothetical protein
MTMMEDVYCVVVMMNEDSRQSWEMRVKREGGRFGEGNDYLYY